MRAYLIAVMSGAILCLAGASYVGWGRVASLNAENAALTASVSALTAQIEITKEAREVADARAKRAEAQALEYSQLRERILRDGQDAALPDWMRDFLIGLRAVRTPHPDNPVDPE